MQRGANRAPWVGVSEKTGRGGGGRMDPAWKPCSSCENAVMEERGDGWKEKESEEGQKVVVADGGGVGGGGGGDTGTFRVEGNLPPPWGREGGGRRGRDEILPRAILQRAASTSATSLLFSLFSSPPLLPLRGLGAIIPY
ncbi:hypothetical protein KM043_008603 [Ampulex compressa]|nr:hypothetical protein KM043_008603 [Ampulex compressa]